MHVLFLYTALLQSSTSKYGIPSASPLIQVQGLLRELPGCDYVLVPRNMLVGTFPRLLLWRLLKMFVDRRKLVYILFFGKRIVTKY